MEKLKKILTGIWTFLNSRVFIILLVVLLFLFLAGQCKRILDNQQEIMIKDQNISALTDSLKFERTKYGELLVTIDGYIATEKELKTLNRGLWNEVNKQKGKVISLSDVVIRLQQDSTVLEKTVDHLKTIIGQLQKINDSTYIAPWVLAYVYNKDSTSYDIFKGKTEIGVLNKDPLVLRHKNSYLTKRETQIELIFGQKVENNKLRIFIQSDYPGFTVKSLEGVLLDPNDNPLFKDLYKKRHWFSGWNISISTTYGWNFITQKPSLVIGPTFGYSIYTW